MSEPASTCPICGGALLGAHCKLICRNCGYREDCSDLFPPEQRCEVPEPPADPDS
jgi:hypothetical protein